MHDKRIVAWIAASHGLEALGGGLALRPLHSEELKLAAWRYPGPAKSVVRRDTKSPDNR